MDMEEWDLCEAPGFHRKMKGPGCGPVKGLSSKVHCMWVALIPEPAQAVLC